MKSLICLIMLFLSCGLNAQTKVIVALVTTIQDEPRLVESFVTGYETSGKTWTGSVRYIENASQSNVSGSLMRLARDSGYSMILRNTGLLESYKEYDSLYAYGIQLVGCAGSNYYRDLKSSEYVHSPIVCGAGYTQNQTAYHCEMYDEHPYSEYNILSITDSSGFAIMTTNNGFFGFDSSGYGYQMSEISGVSGYSNNPNGNKIIHKFYQNGLYNKFRIRHNLGSGSYSSGGIVKIFYQSYSHAYIAGKLAAVKDSLNCSWWEARYRLRTTASGNGLWSTYNGFGRPNTTAAINYNGTIPQDPFNTIGQIGSLNVVRSGNNVRLSIDTVTNAIIYYIYNNTQLVATWNYSQAMSALTNPLLVPISRTGKTNPHQFWYQASRLSQLTQESDKYKMPYYYWHKFKYKNND